jgi:hypothetical protein
MASSRIVQAVNAMVAHPNQIEEVIRRDTEIFFTYRGQTLLSKWSIRRDDGPVHWLFMYPGKQTLPELAEMNEDEWQEFGEMVVYRDDEIGTREAKASFADLYNVLTEKLFGADKVLDDIIDDIPF